MKSLQSFSIGLWWQICIKVDNVSSNNDGYGEKKDKAVET